jgi:NAD-dependent SIR2 family protein deacetylase
MYCDSISEIKDSSDLYVVHKSEFCYDDIYCQNSNRLFYSEKSISCIDSYFLYDCRNCTNCFMSSNLRNKSYVFYNKQLTKEEYRQKISKINLSSYDQIEILRKEFKSLKINSIHKFFKHYK